MGKGDKRDSEGQAQRQQLWQRPPAEADRQGRGTLGCRKDRCEDQRDEGRCQAGREGSRQDRRQEKHLPAAKRKRALPNVMKTPALCGVFFGVFQPVFGAP